jgi:hypothetical protein
MNLLPRNMKENPIYIRHTSRFRGFLAGYFEPSGNFKSRVVLQALIPIIFLVFIFSEPMMVYWAAMGAMAILTLISPFDAYVRLARLHRERLAWESILIAPMSGSSLMTGTWGVLLAHRFMPILPGSVWLVLIGMAAQVHPLMTLGILLGLFVLYFSGLSMAASGAWFIALQRVSSFFFFIWGLLTCCAVAVVVYHAILTIRYTGSHMTDYLIIASIAVLSLIIGFAAPSIMGNLFDRYGRLPFKRQTEEGE